jgi:hypothetical protein
MVNDDVKVATLRKCRRTFGEWSPGQGRRQEDGEWSCVAIGQQGVDHGLGFGELRARESCGTGFQLKFGDEGALMRLDVRAQSDTAASSNGGHRVDIVAQLGEVAQQRRRGDEVSRVRSPELAQRGRIRVCHSTVFTHEIPT